MAAAGASLGLILGPAIAAAAIPLILAKLTNTDWADLLPGGSVNVADELAARGYTIKDGNLVQTGPGSSAGSHSPPGAKPRGVQKRPKLRFIQPGAGSSSSSSSPSGDRRFVFELPVYLDGQKIAQNTYEHAVQASALA
jgi:hypothetical protein